MENITLDPTYENLIIEVNQLKDKVSEKIAERDMLAFHIIPDIESKYFIKIGMLENDAFVANLKFIRTKRKLDLYNEKIKSKSPIDEKEIEEQLDLEFDDVEDEYNELQDELLEDFDEDDDYSDEVTEEFLKLVNKLYKNLIKKLSPLVNFDNTRIDNQLYELLEKSYRDLDLNMMTKIQVICEQIKRDSNITVGDVKTLEKAKTKYTQLIEENEEIILHIKCSETFDKKRILEDENLYRRTKEEINEEIIQIEQKTKEVEKELKKIMKSL